MQAVIATRPIIYEYSSIPTYLAHMHAWVKSNIEEFSIRSRCESLRRCSPALVSQVMAGRRTLTPERVDDFAKIFELSTSERAFLKQWALSLGNDTQMLTEQTPTQPTRKASRRDATLGASDHLLNDPLNVYIKDAARIDGFRDDVKVIARILGGIASEKRVEKSLKYLLSQGYLRRTLDGRLVENDGLVATSDNIPSQKIRNFHKYSLDIAKRAIDLFPVESRRASAIVLPLNTNTRDKLKQLLQEFYENVLQFAEHHPDDNEQLYQVLINLSPVGVKIKNEH